jgi:RNA polymerase sigma factor (sigma-70 family)
VEAATADSADTGIVMDEFAATLQATLDAMTPRVREILLMSRVHAMSNAEIAHTLELSVPTVKSQLSRALKQLAEGLALE